MFQLECSQEAHSHSTQRSDSIQAGTKRQVRVVCYLIFSPYQKAKFESGRLDDAEHNAKRKNWTEKQLPEIIEKARKEGSIVLFGDEVSFALLGWSIVKLAEVPGCFNGESYIEFLKQLMKNSDKRIILIEDGAPYHGTTIVKNFVKKTQNI